MIELDTTEIKKNFHMQLLKIEFKIEHPIILSCLAQMAEDEDCYVEGEIAMATDAIIGQDTVFLSYPGEIDDYMNENYEYYIASVFLVPSLLPYIDEPDFKPLMEELMICTEGYASNLIELVHLPNSEMPNEDEIFEDFKDKHATFMVGVSEKGGINDRLVIEFLTEVESFAKRIDEYVKEKQARGENVAEDIAGTSETETKTAAA